MDAKRVVLSALLVSPFACAPVYSSIEYDGFGAADPGRDRKIREAAPRFELDEEMSKSTVVLVDTVPKGVMLKERSISVEEGYGHVVLGKFIVRRGNGGFFSAFADYKEEWKKPVCWWQDPLKFLTSGIWAIVPTYYPCFTTNEMDKEGAIEEVKRVARAAGGDFAIMSYITDRHLDLLGAVGYVGQLDARLRDGGLETAPIEKPLRVDVLDDRLPLLASTAAR